MTLMFYLPFGNIPFNPKKSSSTDNKPQCCQDCDLYHTKKFALWKCICKCHSSTGNSASSTSNDGKSLTECQKCGSMNFEIRQGLCPCCQNI